MGFYETESCISQGKGGISNFRIYKNNEEKSKCTDSDNTFIIVGEKKVIEIL